MSQITAVILTFCPLTASGYGIRLPYVEFRQSLGLIGSSSGHALREAGRTRHWQPVLRLGGPRPGRRVRTVSPSTLQQARSRCEDEQLIGQVFGGTIVARIWHPDSGKTRITSPEVRSSILALWSTLS
jgi:hypothetical protein